MRLQLAKTTAPSRGPFRTAIHVVHTEGEGEKGTPTMPPRMDGKGRRRTLPPLRTPFVVSTYPLLRALTRIFIIMSSHRHAGTLERLVSGRCEDLRCPSTSLHDATDRRPCQCLATASGWVYAERTLAMLTSSLSGTHQISTVRGYAPRVLPTIEAPSTG